MIEFQVWAVPPGKDKKELMAAFEPCRWQWAQKLYQFLKDTDHSDVEVIEDEIIEAFPVQVDT